MWVTAYRRSSDAAEAAPCTSRGPQASGGRLFQAPLWVTVCRRESGAAEAAPSTSRVPRASGGRLSQAPLWVTAYRRSSDAAEAAPCTSPGPQASGGRLFQAPLWVTVCRRKSGAAEAAPSVRTVYSGLPARPQQGGHFLVLDLAEVAVVLADRLETCRRGEAYDFVRVRPHPLQAFR